MAEENQQEMQQKYMQFQLFQQQMEQVQKQMQLMEKQLVELHVVKEALKDLANTKEGTEILVPVSSGIFIKAELKNNKKVTINVGSDVATEKTMAQAEELIVKQIEELGKVKEQLTGDASNMAVQAIQLEQELKKMVEDV